MQQDTNNPTSPSQPDPSKKDRNERVRPIEYALVAIIAGAIGIMAVPDLDLPRTDMVGMAQVTQLQYKMGVYRQSLEDYREDHNFYPGYGAGQKGCWERGELSAEVYRRQLMQRSTELGLTNVNDSSRFPFGPYLSIGMIKNPVNGLDTVRLLRDDQDFPADPDGATGWLFKPATGELHANCDGVSAVTGISYFDL
jgi:hypothetical protein